VGLSSPTHFLQTLAAASLSPLACWSLHRRAFCMEPPHKTIITEPSTQSLLHGAFSAEPLYQTIIEHSSRTFIQSLRRETFSGRAFVGRLRLGLCCGPSLASLHPETFSGRAIFADLLRLAFVRRPSPAGPSSGDLPRPSLRRGPSPASLLRETSRRPSPIGLLPMAFSRRPSPAGLLQLAFSEEPSTLNPVRDACPNIIFPFRSNVVPLLS
jgi:hypothetical protein